MNQLSRNMTYDWLTENMNRTQIDSYLSILGRCSYYDYYSIVRGARRKRTNAIDE